jgi:hypothetical protein
VASLGPSEASPEPALDRALPPVLEAAPVRAGRVLLAFEDGVLDTIAGATAAALRALVWAADRVERSVLR